MLDGFVILSREVKNPSDIRSNERRSGIQLCADLLVSESFGEASQGHKQVRIGEVRKQTVRVERYRAFHFFLRARPVPIVNVLKVT